jgi:CO/xanthine dehydrogenase Mo-binding subunit
VEDVEFLSSLLTAYDTNQIKAYPVSAIVGNVKNDLPTCIGGHRKKANQFIRFAFYLLFTGDKFPVLTGTTLADRPPLAVEKVRYFGEPFAVVVAKTELVTTKR